MNTQVNVRFPPQLLDKAQRYAATNGYGSVQELMKEAVREKMDDNLTPKEERLIEQIIKETNEKDAWIPGEEVFKSLRKSGGSRSRNVSDKRSKR